MVVDKVVPPAVSEAHHEAVVKTSTKEVEVFEINNKVLCEEIVEIVEMIAIGHIKQHNKLILIL